MDDREDVEREGMKAEEEIKKIEAEARKSLKEGEFLYHERRRKDAIKPLEYAAKQFEKIHLHKKAGESYFLLGESLRKAGGIVDPLMAEKSAGAYKKSGDMYPKIDAYQESANSYMWAGAMFKQAVKNIGEKAIGKSPNLPMDEACLWWEAHDCYRQSGLRYANAHMWEEAGNSYHFAGVIYKEIGQTNLLKSWQWKDMAHCCYKSGYFRVKVEEYKVAAEDYEEAGKLYEKEEDIDIVSKIFETVLSGWTGEKVKRGERAGESFALSADNYRRVEKYEEAAKNYELSARNHETSQRWGEVWRNYKGAIVFKAKAGRKYPAELLSKMQKAVENDTSNVKERLSILRDAYLELRNAYSDAGMYDVAGEFFYEEKVIERRIAASICRKVFYRLLEITCGYGEKPEKAVGVSLMLVLGFALIFLFTGITGINNESIVTAWMDKQYNLIPLYAWHSVYFSCITFTTLGYGDFHPTGGLSQFFAIIEAFFGVFMIAIFIFTFGRKMMR